MKKRNVERHLREKIDEWLDSIEDKAVRQMAAKGTIVCGGSIASLLLDERVHDYDIYLKDKATCKAVAEYYLMQVRDDPPEGFAGGDIELREEEDGRLRILVQSEGVDGSIDTVLADDDDEPEEELYRPIFVSSNAITLSGKIQICVRFYGAAIDIIKNYDFVHVTNYWCSWTGKLTLHKNALEALLARELRVISHGTKYPFSAICRIRKYLARGFYITAGQILKLCFALNKLDLTDLAVLEEQLMGVDWTYFQEMIRYLEENKEKALDEDGRVRVPYLVTLLDRML